MDQHQVDRALDAAGIIPLPHILVPWDPERAFYLFIYPKRCFRGQTSRMLCVMVVLELDLEGIHLLTTPL